MYFNNLDHNKQLLKIQLEQQFSGLIFSDLLRFLKKSSCILGYISHDIEGEDTDESKSAGKDEDDGEREGKHESEGARKS